MFSIPHRYSAGCYGSCDLQHLTGQSNAGHVHPTVQHDRRHAQLTVQPNAGHAQLAVQRDRRHAHHDRRHTHHDHRHAHIDRRHTHLDGRPDGNGRRSRGIGTDAGRSSPRAEDRERHRAAEAESYSRR